MTTKDEDMVLEALGLAGCRFSREESVPWPDHSIGHARGVSPRELTQAVLRSLRVVPIGAGLLSSIGVTGFAAADGSGRVKFVGAETVSVRVAGPAGGRVVHSAEEPNVAWVDASSGPFLLETATGRLLCSVQHNQLQLRLVSDGFEPLAAIEEPADGWLRSSRDEWLQAEAQRTLEGSGPWAVSVAAGLHARLADAAAFGAPADALQAVLAGESPSWLSGPRRWVRSLTPEQVSTMRRLALAEVDRLSEIADRLDHSDVESAEWREDWRRLCHSRDDLEGVRVLLGEVGASRELDDHLRALDGAGALLRAGAPLARMRADERLRRARLSDADAWWGWLE